VARPKKTKLQKTPNDANHPNGRDSGMRGQRGGPEHGAKRATGPPWGTEGRGLRGGSASLKEKKGGAQRMGHWKEVGMDSTSGGGVARGLAERIKGKETPGQDNVINGGFGCTTPCHLRLLGERTSESFKGRRERGGGPGQRKECVLARGNIRKIWVANLKRSWGRNNTSEYSATH